MSTNHHTAIATTSAANAATFNAPLGQLDSAISTLGSTSNPFNDAAFDAATTLTIATGVITPTQALHLVAAETGTTDTLTTITAVANALIFLKADVGDTITIDVSGGNINSFDNGNFNLTGDVVIALFCQNSQWSVIGAYNAPYTPTNTNDWIVDPTNGTEAWDDLASRTPYYGYINGLEVYCSDADTIISVRRGEAMDDTFTRIMRPDFPDYNNDANINCAVTGINGLDAGSLASSTLYYVFICEGTSGVGFLASTSQSAPTLPAGYNTYKRRIGCVRTNVSSTLLGQKTIGSGKIREVRYTAVTKAAPFQIADSVNLGNGSGAATTIDFSTMISDASKQVIALVGCETASAAVDVYWFVNNQSSLIMPNLTTGHAYWAEMSLPTDNAGFQNGAAYGDADDEDFSFYVLGYVEDLL